MGCLLSFQTAIATGPRSSESLATRLGRNIAASERGFQSQPPTTTPFQYGGKKRLAAPQETIYNCDARDGTRQPRNAFFLLHSGLYFIFAGSDVVSGRLCAVSFRLANDEYDDG
jgi:hypothetical protein